MSWLKDMLGNVCCCMVLWHSDDSPILPVISCQSRLEECLRERAELLQVQEAANKQREKDKGEHKRAREVWEKRRKELESDFTRLQEELMQSQEKIEEMKREQKVLYRHWPKEMTHEIIQLEPMSVTYYFHIYLHMCPYSLMNTTSTMLKQYLLMLNFI